MSVAAGTRRCHAPRAVAAWAVAGALGAFTLAAMLSIGVFLLIPTVCVFVLVAKRYGTVGCALGLPIGAACTIAVLALLVAANSSSSSGGGSGSGSALGAPR